MSVKPDYPDPARRMLITVSILLSTTMVAVDMTIANVGLPQMQSTMAASQDQIVWVLTSYIVVAAIATPLGSWLAGRFGRKLVMVTSVAGFTLASLLCGLANDLTTIVFARAIQGACGASLIPLGQAMLLDINPPDDQPKAMAMFSLGSMAGPLIGPTLGGWLTDTLSWRWVFFVNLPFGLLALLAMSAAIIETRGPSPSRFDKFGFATVSIAIGSFQLMIDRGQQLDWFESTEICIYAVMMSLSLWLALVHMFTARNTFIRPDLFKDRNFAVGSVLSAAIGVVAFSTIPVIVVMMQTLLGYTALHTGIVGLPRAVGTLFAMLWISRIIGRIDPRLIMSTGLGLTALSLAMYSGIDLYVDGRTLVIIGLIQGVGGGLLFVPLSIMVFVTLPAQFRNEGAALFALTRNIGQSIGISLIQRQLVLDAANSRAHLVTGVRPDNPNMDYAMPDFQFGSAEAMAKLNLEISRQANMVADVHAFWLLCLVALALMPLVMLMRTGGKSVSPRPLPVME